MNIYSLDKNNYKGLINQENSDKLFLESYSNLYEENNKVFSMNNNNIGFISFFRSNSI